MSDSAFARLRSFDLEAYRGAGTSTVIIRIRARWLSSIGGIEFTQFDWELPEPESVYLDKSVAGVLQQIIDRL